MKGLQGIVLFVVGSSLIISAQVARAQSEPPTPEMSIDAMNSSVTAARTATKEKRFGDAEALMLKVTESQPKFVIPWVELGLAQLGLKKYMEAEFDFERALGIDPKSQELAHADDFFVSADSKSPDAEGMKRSRNTLSGTTFNGEKIPPEVKGVCHAGLGEIYAKTGKIPESQKEFDEAVKVYPADTALYRRNQTIFYFQVGNSDAQLDAANQAIAADPSRASNYYFKAQALVSKASVDGKTGKIQLPAGCAEAYQKYLSMEPAGPFSADAKAVLASAGFGSGKK